MEILKTATAPFIMKSLFLVPRTPSGKYDLKMKENVLTLNCHMTKR